MERNPWILSKQSFYQYISLCSISSEFISNIFSITGKYNIGCFNLPPTEFIVKEYSSSLVISAKVADFRRQTALKICNHEKRYISFTWFNVIIYSSKLTIRKLLSQVSADKTQTDLCYKSQSIIRKKVFVFNKNSLTLLSLRYTNLFTFHYQKLY